MPGNPGLLSQVYVVYIQNLSILVRGLIDVELIFSVLHIFALVPIMVVCGSLLVNILFLTIGDVSRCALLCFLSP